MKRALFFDLDGTLWNALEPLLYAYNLAMEEEGKPYRFDLSKIQSIMGLTPEESCPVLFPNDTLEEGLRLFKACYDMELKVLAKHPGTLYPSVRETLAELKKSYPLYIVSNADKGYIENFLSACHMEEYFEGFVQAGDTGLAKWQNILYLKEREGVDEVIYVGDTRKDYLETMMAKEKFVHAAYGFGVIEEEVEAIMAFEQLLPVVKKLFF